MKSMLLGVLIAAILVQANIASAQSVDDLVVNATANIFGAGKTEPPAPAGNGGGILPVEVEIAFSPGASITFPAVSGEIACCADRAALNGADGGTFSGLHSDVNSFGGISGIVHDQYLMFLVGVFLDDTEPADPAPDRRNVTNDNGEMVISPALKQSFFIGDGKTADGQPQSFIAPQGATRLFLGFADSCEGGDVGCYSDNRGQLQVQVQNGTPPQIDVTITGPTGPISVNDDIIVTAEANDPDNQIEKIQFFIDSFPERNWIGTDFDVDGDDIYSHSWTFPQEPDKAPPVTEGTHFATVRALGENKVLLYQTPPGGEFEFTVGPEVARRTVSVVDASGPLGGTVRVPVELLSEGDENALGFSLQFDANVLTSPAVSLGQDVGRAILNVNDSELNMGRLGIALALQAGQTFSAGEREIVVVDFDILSNTTAEGTRIRFVDQPISREVSDASANALEAEWIPGAVRILQGYECDVAPRFRGDEKVSIVDWVQSGRFVAGLDDINMEGNEFQRADSAPRADGDRRLLGDGNISITDWVQCGRYASGIDPLTRAGGPLGPNLKVSPTASSYQKTRTLYSYVNQQRVARLPDEYAGSGDEVTLVVEFDAEGDENALGFSVGFDPAYLTYVAAEAGESLADGVLLNINDINVESGRVGIAMALPTGTTFNAGTQKILNVSFVAFASNVTDSTKVLFTDNPIAREISDASANVLEAAYEDGSVVYAVNIDIDSVPLPNSEGFRLKPNYPNPFRSSTSIVYSIPKPVHVTLKIFNVLGQEVENLVDSFQQPGSYTVHWSSGGLESGIYFYQLQAEDFTATRKLTVLR